MAGPLLSESCRAERRAAAMEETLAEAQQRLEQRAEQQRTKVDLLHQANSEKLLLEKRLGAAKVGVARRGALRAAQDECCDLRERLEEAAAEVARKREWVAELEQQLAKMSEQLFDSRGEGERQSAELVALRRAQGAAERRAAADRTDLRRRSEREAEENERSGELRLLLAHLEARLRDEEQRGQRLASAVQQADEESRLLEEELDGVKAAAENRKAALRQAVQGGEEERDERARLQAPPALSDHFAAPL